MPFKNPEDKKAWRRRPEVVARQRQHEDNYQEKRQPYYRLQVQLRKLTIGFRSLADKAELSCVKVQKAIDSLPSEDVPFYATKAGKVVVLEKLTHDEFRRICNNFDASRLNRDRRKGPARNAKRRKPAKDKDKLDYPFYWGGRGQNIKKEFKLVTEAEYRTLGEKGSIARENSRRCTGYDPSKVRYNRDPELKRRRLLELRLQAKYGMSLRQHDALMSVQDSRCARCGIELSQMGKSMTSPVVDHCHETGMTRGIICSACNKAEGFIRSLDHLDSLRRYMFGKDASNLLLWGKN